MSLPPAAQPAGMSWVVTTEAPTAPRGRTLPVTSGRRDAESTEVQDGKRDKEREVTRGTRTHRGRPRGMPRRWKTAQWPSGSWSIVRGKTGMKMQNSEVRFHRWLWKWESLGTANGTAGPDRCFLMTGRGAKALQRSGCKDPRRWGDTWTHILNPGIFPRRQSGGIATGYTG